MAGLSISGERPNNTNFPLDGAPNIDADYSSHEFAVHPRHHPGIPGADRYVRRRKNGHADGQVNVATKSGLNHLQGSAWEFIPLLSSSGERVARITSPALEPPPPRQT
jgi:hypothetical protein